MPALSAGVPELPNPNLFFMPHPYISVSGLKPEAVFFAAESDLTLQVSCDRIKGDQNAAGGKAQAADIMI